MWGQHVRQSIAQAAACLWLPLLCMTDKMPVNRWPMETRRAQNGVLVSSKEDEIVNFVRKWTELEIMLRETRQTQTNTMFSLR